MAEKVQAIVIKSNDKKEKDKNILLFSLEQGKFWATLKGVKGANAKMKLAQSPFCYGEFVIENGKAGQIVTSFEAIETFHEISEDIDKYFEANAILQVLNSLDFSTTSERARVFVLALKALKSICFDNIKSVYVLDKFFIELFKSSGFPLYSDKCSGCGDKTFDKIYVNYSVGELVCFSCKTFDAEELSKSAYTALKIFGNTAFERLSTLKLAKDSEIVLLRILVKVFEAHFDKKLNLMGILS